MLPTEDGSMRIARVAGIQVSVHWSWLLIGYLIIETRRDQFSSIGWNVAEYLALFVIVLLHEFGHAFACRQVGGQADRIVLWPLGGVAYVRPPHRPGAELWSIAAGPLVNVALIPVLWFASRSVLTPEMVQTNPDLVIFFHDLAWINTGLLIFNMLPIYPLDGGQILRSLLWFGIGEVRSLKVAVVIGFIGAAAFGAYAVMQRSIWMGVLALFMFMNCRSGWNYAQALAEHERSRQ